MHTVPAVLRFRALQGVEGRTTCSLTVRRRVRARARASQLFDALITADVWQQAATDATCNFRLGGWLLPWRSRRRRVTELLGGQEMLTMLQFVQTLQALEMFVQKVRAPQPQPLPDRYAARATAEPFRGPTGDAAEDAGGGERALPEGEGPAGERGNREGTGARKGDTHRHRNLSGALPPSPAPAPVS